MISFWAEHWLDIVTTVLGLAYILLEYKASIWMWAVGFAMQALGIVLYYQKGLYADCGMEFYYLAMTVYGYGKWKTHPRPLPAEGGGIKSILPSLSREGTGVGLLIIAAIWGIIYWLLVTFTNSTVPLADSFTTALSIVGIWALAHKYLEQWFIWIVVDVVTCVLYWHKDIPFKASLYAIYVVIAVCGYIKWRKMMGDPPRPLPV